MKYSWILALLFVYSTNAFAQEKFVISGKIKDAASGEDLIGATISIKEANTGVTSNEYGFFSITLPQGTYTVLVDYMGYAEYQQIVELNSNQKIDIELSTESTQLKEVVVSGEKLDKNVREVQMSVSQVDIKQIKKMPALLGEVDIVRSIQLLPGVSTVGEGATGFNVRGGNIDQNLVLIDEAPVFNSAHLFGFFSVFNPDAVKDVKLIKGGIPANYGGRLSSILDVRLKDGNSKKLKVNGAVGLIFSRLAIEGPINKGKGSFIVAGRRSYIDVLAKPFLSGELKDTKFYFYDLTMKANYTLGKNDKIFASAYLGRDVFGAGFQFNWGSATTSLRWNHVFNDKLFLNLTTYYSNYDYLLGTVSDTKDGDGFTWKSNIISYSVKPDLTWYFSPKHTINFGVQSIYYTFKPGTAETKSAGVTTAIGLDSKYAIENAAYIADEHTVSDKLTLQYGLRFSSFGYLGKGTAYEFAEVAPGLRKELTGTKTYDSFEAIKVYNNFEPRFSAKYELNNTSSIKGSYNRTAQYLNLVSNTAASVPLDVWTPSTNNVKPQLADQVALGYFRNFKDNTYEASVEGYYKIMQNQIDYVNNANLLLNKYLEADLLSGKGRAYGAEFSFKKNKGIFTGWISYTLSRSERLTKGVNNDDWYKSRFDRPHNLNVVASLDISTRWSLSANFVFASGTPISLAPNKIDLEGFPVPHDPKGLRNNYRIPPTHRLDLSATLNCKKKEGRKYEWNLVFSIYNVYNRRNAFGVYRNPSDSDYNKVGPDDKIIKTPNVSSNIRYSIIGSLIPAISYNFKF